MRLNAAPRRGFEPRTLKLTASCPPAGGLSRHSIKVWLPEPWANITLDFEAIIQAFQDIRYIGELRQRWNEIKKLQKSPALAIV